MNSRFSILSLSGGGYFGLFTITLLNRIQEVCDVPIARKFDLLAGTSVGGIIAIALAAEIPTIRIKQEFEERGQSIFSQRAAPEGMLSSIGDLARSMLRPKYRADALRRTVENLVGSEATMGDLLHPVIVPVVNLTKGRPQIFKTGHHPDFKVDPKRKIVDVALAATAAPTYFPLASVDDELFADGGLYATAPDLLALHEAEHFFGRPTDAIALLSIGTTTAQFSFAHAVGTNLGWLRWLQGQRLVNVMLASQQHSVDFMMRHRLGDRYLRLDAQQSKEQERSLALDVATDAAQRTIRGLADSVFQASINDTRLKAFL